MLQVVRRKKKGFLIFKGLLLIICGSLFLLSGCANKKDNRAFSRANSGYTRKTDSLTFYGEEISEDREQELLAESVVYFDYDKDHIADRYQLVLLAHARNLLDNPSLKLRIDGHTDERGSAEYNIGLGERRAKAVERIMAFKGIPKESLVVVSYGKEQPVVHGHNEEAWRMNRRVELSYE